MLRSATVIAREDVDVLVLSRNALKTLLHSKVLDRQTMMALKKVAEERKQQNALMKEAMHVDALKDCAVFASLTKAKRETIVEAMALQVFEKDQVLCTQGETAEAMYLVMSGKCAVVVGGQTVGTLEKLEVFGESALLGGARNATVRAVTGRVEVLVLLQKDLIMLDQACVAGIKALAQKRKKGNSRRVVGMVGASLLFYVGVLFVTSLIFTVAVAEGSATEWNKKTWSNRRRALLVAGHG
jgi:CRP-like cAMP-binding protein